MALCWFPQLPKHTCGKQRGARQTQTERMGLPCEEKEVHGALSAWIEAGVVQNIGERYTMPEVM
eukprot:8967510-Pyramimonas_sp.AAC.1